MAFKSYLIGSGIFSNEQEAFSLQEKSNFGEKEESKIKYSLVEALYLLEKGKIEIYSKNKKISSQELFKRAQKVNKKISVNYQVYKDLRNKGYIIKTALKFGADFRVYEKGIKPGEDHAKWILHTVNESEKLNWQDFSAKNRVAHSTKKNLLIAIVDEENDVTYYEISWIRP